jgi:hypothetical protein
MHRILLCLPVCLCLGSDRPDIRPTPPAVVAQANVVKDNGGALPSAADLERLARNDPIGFLEACLQKYAREVKGYTLQLKKQEYLAGKLNPTETIDVSFQDKPHSVLFIWKEGARLAERALYVEGENDNKMLARPNGGVARLVAGDIVARDVDGDDARKSGRYPLNQFGFKKSMERTLLSWKAGKDKGDLKVDYQGVQKVKELAGRSCHVFRRSGSGLEPGVKESTIYVDSESWLQVGVVLKGEDGLLMGSYWFGELKLNPKFDKDRFTRAALKP